MVATSRLWGVQVVERGRGSRGWGLEVEVQGIGF